MQNANKTKKILLTGGHAATTALSLIEELIRRNKGFDLYWIGSRFSMEGKNVQGIELKVLPKLGVKTYTITTGKFHRNSLIHGILSLFKVPIGFIQSIKHVLKIKPDITVSFGGYAAFPVTLSSWILGIPVIIHEQTTVSGLSNRISGLFAKKILLANAESKKYFSEGKVQVIGNPVMTQICEVTPKTEIGSPPSILVMGGSRGSVAINDAVLDVLAKLTKSYRITHIIGETDFDRFSRFKSVNYMPYTFIDPMEMDNVYREADIIVARSGANTVSELKIVKRPCILIPIPWSYLNEQAKNAESAKEFGIAEIINQNTLTGRVLLEKIDFIGDNWEKIVEKVKNKKSIDVDASRRFADIIWENI